MANVSFLLSAKALGMSFDPTPPTELQFEASGTPNCLIRLRQWDRDNGERALEVQCSAAFEVSEWERDFIAAQLERRYLASATMPLKLPYRINGETHIEADGSMREGFGIPFEFLPPEIQALCGRAREHLTATLSRFIKLLRWEQASPGAHALFEYSPSLYWALGREDYHKHVKAPREDFETSALGGVKWGAEHEERMALLWSSEGVEEPLAHELLREACYLANGGSPRSALLIAVSAVETGLKNHISRHVKSSGWLVECAQSPPVYKILRDYIPDLHVESNPEMKWSGIRHLSKKLQTYVELRNQLIQYGKANFDNKDAFALVDLVSDILYVLDFLSGHVWAQSNVSSALARELGWSVAEGKGIRINVLSGYPLPND